MALDYDYGKAKKYQRAKRSVSIIAGENSYYPEQLVVFAGEEVSFFVTGIDSQSGCFMLPTKNIFISAKKGELSSATAVFDTPGIYKFHCPKGQMSGQVVVLLHPKDKQRKDLRRIASQKIIKVWRPKEE